MPPSIPNFILYGEPDRPLTVGFTHVETVMDRKSAHFGRVGAHQHDRLAQITFWTRGRGTYRIEDTELDFHAPAVSFIPSGTVHGFTVEPETSDAIVASMADSALPPILPLVALPLDRPIIIAGQENDPVWPKLAAVMERLLADYRSGTTAALGALYAVALNDIAQLARSGAAASLPETDRLAHRFRALVDRHYRENWPVERYVESLGTTPHLLAKACRSAFAGSVKSTIDERRLVEAKRLLLFTVHSIEDIAFEIGLRDPAYFSRFFRQRTGLAPKLWRERHGPHTPQ